MHQVELALSDDLGRPMGSCQGYLQEAGLVGPSWITAQAAAAARGAAFRGKSSRY